MNNPNMFPMQPMAQQMAQQGRYGDSMMVHMNPIEVAGIASLSPTGQLTTNPMTGQPEAFLPFLAPLLGSLAGSTFLTGSTLGGLTGALGLSGGISSAAAGAIGSGLATTALTGDIKEGLLSGLTGFGVGKALGSAAQALDPAVTEAAAKTAATEALAAETVGGAAKTGAQTLLEGGTRDAAIQATQDVAAQGARDIATQRGLEQVARQKAEEGLGQSFLNQPGKFAAEAGKGLLNPMSAVPIAVGEGQRAAFRQQDEMDRLYGERAAEKEQDLRDAQGIVDASIRQAGSDYGIDYSKEYGRDYGMMGGGITSINPDDFQRRHAELQMMGRQPVQMDSGGQIRDINLSNIGTMGGFGAPSGRQSKLRGPEVIKPEELVGTRPGFQSEISYFRDRTPEESTAALEKITGGAAATQPIDPALLQGIGAVGKGGGMSGMSVPIPKEVRDAQKVLEGPRPKKMALKSRIEAQKIVDAYDAGEYGNYYDSIEENVYGMQEGGDTTGQMDQSMAMQLIEQVSMALLGRLPEEQAEVVINRFIDEFGSEAFQMLRSQVLESVVPNSQKEGVIQGEGKGMDDQVPGMIGDQQPVAVSPGEFIVPADVVSGIGDGDTNSGVQELEGMMDRVRQDRTGTMQQPAPLGAKAGGALPA
jgi:hypothetical protein